MTPEEIVEELSWFASSLARSSTRDVHAQDDLRQEAFIAAVGVTLSYPNLPAADVVLLAKRAMRNRLIDCARKGRSTVRLDRKAAKEEAVPPSDDAMVRDMGEFIKARIGRFDREVFDLTAEGFNPDEVASILECARGSVYRALGKISKEAE